MLRVGGRSSAPRIEALSLFKALDALRQPGAARPVMDGEVRARNYDLTTKGSETRSSRSLAMSVTFSQHTGASPQLHPQSDILATRRSGPATTPSGWSGTRLRQSWKRPWQLCRMSTGRGQAKCRSKRSRTPLLWCVLSPLARAAAALATRILSLQALGQFYRLAVGFGALDFAYRSTGEVWSHLNADKRPPE